jgi:hypothetical protein
VHSDLGVIFGGCYDVMIYFAAIDLANDAEV